MSTADAPAPNTATLRPLNLLKSLWHELWEIIEPGIEIVRAVVGKTYDARCKHDLTRPSRFPGRRRQFEESGRPPECGNLHIFQFRYEASLEFQAVINKGFYRHRKADVSIGNRALGAMSFESIFGVGIV